MKKLTISLLSLILLLFTPLALSVTVSAQASLACDGLSTSGGSCDAAPDTEPQVSGVIETSLDILSFVAGVIAVVMVIIAGVRFITSQGDAGKVAGARSAVIYALIGVVIVVLAQTIVFFVIRESTPSPPANTSQEDQIDRYN